MTETRTPVIAAIQAFLSLEAAGGILLVVAAGLAMVIANSPLADAYSSFLHLHLSISVGDHAIDKTIHHWINDGLMAIFFFVVGLEIKREVLDGELSDPRQVVLPMAAAIGGMAVPALVYWAINAGDAVGMRGWAVPMATDIAFALGVLTLLGDRVPRSLKLFLLTLAIIDDLGAIIVIALFYAGTPSITSFVVAGAALLVLIAMNRGGITRISPYLLVGLVLWAAVLESGVHATIAGVLLAFTIPLRTTDEEASPLRRLEHDLHGPVAHGILPLFAFANAGIDFHGMTIEMLAHPVPLGIAAGLFVGKQIGVFLPTWILIKAGFAHMPEGATWGTLYAVAILCGIGFTMSLFVASLAFSSGSLPVDERIGVVLGSLISAVVGYVLLRTLAPRRHG